MGKSSEPKIFVSVAERTLQEVEQAVSNVHNSSFGLELRLDYLEDIHELDESFKEFIRQFRFTRILATCRRTSAGGKFTGTIEEQFEVLKKAVQAGCQFIDVEIESIKKRKAQDLQRLFHPANLIISYHNFHRCPPLEPIYRRLINSGAKTIKIATAAKNLQDNLKIFQLLHAHRRRSTRVIALAVGPAGIPSRILGLQKGSYLTYASPSSHSGVSPGMVAADIMRTSYQVEQLTEKTQLYGIVGSHVSISLSPIMHNAALHAKRINAVYVPFETQRLTDFIKLVKNLKIQGFSVTMPFKKEIFKHLDWVDPLAERIGAVNTVAVRRGKWFGWNTDAAAVTEVLSKRIRLSGSRVLVLGAGGAARAAAYALQAEGASVYISARRHSAAVRLARAIRAQALQWETPDWLEADSVINATPVGMSPLENFTPTDLSRLRTRVVFDMIYQPIETRLMAEARRRGLVAISGLEMLVAQGARQFEIWTSETAPRALMEQAARQGLTR